MYDFGYDVTDYREVAPEFGTMADFDRLMAEAKSLGVKVVLDYVPNHTSNESEWFAKSCRREDGYDDWYVWADGTPNPEDPEKPLPPNNWVSIFRNSAWEYNEARGQFYLHQFLVGQPDLNYREPRVREEMKEVLRFWLDKGVSGFRVDAINMLYEVDPEEFGGRYPNEPLSGASGTGPDDYEYLDHIYTKDLDETYGVVYDWRDVLDEYIEKQGEYKLMMTEAYTDLYRMLRYYGDGKRNGSIPFNFSFLEDIKNTSNAKNIKVVIDKWMTYMPTGQVANWVNGNHDLSRVASRQGARRVDAFNLLALILPGVSLTYQGEELGMTDGSVSWEATRDPQACAAGPGRRGRSRDPDRTPFHWDRSQHAGFSRGARPWLPVAANYRDLNLEVQMAAPKSHYKFYKDVVALRTTTAVRAGGLETSALNEHVLAVARLQPGARAVVGVINLADEQQEADLSSLRLLPSLLEVKASGVDSSLQKGEKVNKSIITLSPHSAVALQSLLWVPRIHV